MAALNKTQLDYAQKRLAQKVKESREALEKEFFVPELSKQEKVNLVNDGQVTPKKLSAKSYHVTSNIDEFYDFSDYKSYWKDDGKALAILEAEYQLALDRLHLSDQQEALELLESFGKK